MLIRSKVKNTIYIYMGRVQRILRISFKEPESYTQRYIGKGGTEPFIVDSFQRECTGRLRVAGQVISQEASGGCIECKNQPTVPAGIGNLLDFQILVPDRKVLIFSLTAAWVIWGASHWGQISLLLVIVTCSRHWT